MAAGTDSRFSLMGQSSTYSHTVTVVDDGS